MFIAQVATNGASAPWSWSLPPTLQASQIYIIVGLCVATRAMCATLPVSALGLWSSSIIQAIVLAVGCAMAWFIIPDSHVYALGSAWIASALAVQFYALALSWIEARIRGLLGIPSPSPTTITDLSNLKANKTDKIDS